VRERPTFDETDANLEQYLKDNDFKTGEWDNISNEKMPWTNKDNLPEDSHYRVKRDNGSASLKGKEKNKKDKLIYDAATVVAQKHTDKIVEKFKEEKQ